MALTLPLLLVAGCGDAGEAEPVDTFATQMEARAGVPFAQAGAVVSLELPSRVGLGAPVQIKLRVSNTTSAPLDLYLRGRETTFDIVIADSTGDVVWRRLEGEVTQAILQLKTLAPGEVLEASHTWDQKSQRGTPVPAGRYTVRGSILTDGTASLESGAETVQIQP